MLERPRMRRRLRHLLLLGIGLLYLLSIPWYRQAEATPAVWLGLPDWVAVAVLCYVGVAALNTVAWLLTDVPDPAPRASTGGDTAGPADEGGA